MCELWWWLLYNDNDIVDDDDDDRTLCEAWEDTGVGTRVKWDWGFQGLVQLRSLIEEDNDEEDDGDDGGGDDGGGGGDGNGHLEDPEYAHHPYKTKHFPSSADHQGVLHHQDRQDHHDHHFQSILWHKKSHF